MKHIHLDEIEPTPVAGVRWKPVRAELDVQAFGVSAYVADAGELLIEEHDETGGGAGGHEELYVVIAGRATFTVDGSEVDARGNAPPRPARREPPCTRRRGRHAGPRHRRAARRGVPRVRMGGFFLAFAAAQEGDREAALGYLAEAVEKNERVREAARTERAFDAIRDDPRFPA